MNRKITQRVMIRKLVGVRELERYECLDACVCICLYVGQSEPERVNNDIIFFI